LDALASVTASNNMIKSIKTRILTLISETIMILIKIQVEKEISLQSKQNKKQIWVVFIAHE